MSAATMSIKCTNAADWCRAREVEVGKTKIKCITYWTGARTVMAVYERCILLRDPSGSEHTCFALTERAEIVK